MSKQSADHSHRALPLGKRTIALRLKRYLRFFHGEAPYQHELLAIEIDGTRYQTELVAIEID